MKKLLFLFFLSFWSGDGDGYLIEMVSGLEKHIDYYAPKNHGKGMFFSTLPKFNTGQIGVSSIYYSESANKNQLSQAKKVKIKSPFLRGFEVGNLEICEQTQEVFFLANPPPNTEGRILSSIYRGYMDGRKIKNIEPLPFCNGSHSYMQATISPDGKSLVCISAENPIGLYQSTRTSFNDEWSSPELINEFADGQSKLFPNFINDTLLTFSSNMEYGNGLYDIYKSKKINGIWMPPENWKELNSEQNDFGVDMIDEKSGYFSSDRDYGAAKLYYFEIPD